MSGTSRISSRVKVTIESHSRWSSFNSSLQPGVGVVDAGDGEPEVLGEVVGEVLNPLHAVGMMVVDREALAHRMSMSSLASSSQPFSSARRDLSSWNWLPAAEGATDGEEDPVSGGLTGPGVAGDVLGGRSGIEALEGLAVADFRLLVEADDEAGADGGALRVGHHVDQLAQEGAAQGADPVGRPQLAEALLAVVLPVAQGEQGAEEGLALLLAFALVLLALLELGKPGAGVLAQLGEGIPEAVGIEHLVATAPRLFPILEAVFEELVLLVLAILRVLVTDVFPQRFMEELVVVYVLGEVVFVEELLGGGQHLVLDVVEREAQQAGHHLIR